MVVQVDHGGSADGVLHPRDVITTVDGMPIANNGTVQYRGQHRTRYDVGLVGKYVGDKVPLDLVRAGERVRVELVLGPWLPLVPRARYDKPPQYFVYGGLVFQTLTRDFLTTWEKWWNKAPKEFLYYYYSGERSSSRHEVVILTQILADEINVGYSHLYNEAVVAVNGAMPRDLNDFVGQLGTAEGLVEILTSSGGIVMFDAAEVRNATPRILSRYHIAADRSQGLPVPAPR
jgi:hypothetical protein